MRACGQNVHCVVTAGPTWEPVDQVRRLSNFSTGSLGSEFAAYLSALGVRVSLLLGESASYRGPLVADRLGRFSTGADLMNRFSVLAQERVDAVFHAAAVSDYGFGGTWVRGEDDRWVPTGEGKFSTRSGSIFAELVPTPKLLARLRGWFPEAWLLGWKYEVDGTREEALGKGRHQMAEYRTDGCVVNGLAYGDGFGLLEGQLEVHRETREDLYESLFQGLMRRVQRLE